MRIEYQGVISPELFVKAQRVHVGRWRLVPWLFPIVMTLWVWFQYPEASSTFLFLIVPGIGSLFPPAVWLWTVRQWRALHRRSPYLADPINSALTESGIECVSSTASGVIRWSSFLKIKNRTDLMLLYQAPNIFNIVPKEFFESSEAWQCARETIRARAKSGLTRLERATEG